MSLTVRISCMNLKWPWLVSRKMLTIFQKITTSTENKELSHTWLTNILVYECLFLLTKTSRTGRSSSKIHSRDHFKITKSSFEHHLATTPPYNMPGIETGTRSSDPWQQLYDSENARRTSARKIHSLLDGEVLKPQKALKQNTSRTSEGLQKAGRRKVQPSQQDADYDAYDDENHEKVRLWLASANISSSCSSSSSSSGRMEEPDTQQEDRVNETPMSQIANMLGAIMTLSPVNNQPVRDRTPKFSAQRITLTQNFVYFWTKLASDCEIKRIPITCKYKFIDCHHHDVNIHTHLRWFVMNLCSTPTLS